MENKNKTIGIIVGVLVLAIIAGAVVWALNMNNEDTASNVNNDEQTQQTDMSDEQTTGDIVAVATGSADLSTLVTAVKAADLVETLHGDGPFTVFAPNNAAFDALAEGTLDSLLLPENKAQLASILTYHVVPGKVMAADLSDGQVIKTVQGEELTVSIEGDVVSLTDAGMNMIMIETPDVKASNGVVHIISGVLMPKM